MHENFRLGDNTARPLILIGNGTGLAGLLGLIRARAAAGQAETGCSTASAMPPADFHYRELITQWQRDGVLERADIVFSRDQPERRYVQHQLAASAEEVRRWLRADAAIYVCGSLIGMAAGVDEALLAMLGRSELDGLTPTGRYRRDVY